MILFPIQYWFARSITEPYPALLLPSFAGARLDAAGHVSILDADVVAYFEDEDTQMITLGTLFAEAPSSHFQAMAYNALMPKPAPPEDLLSNAGFKSLVPWKRSGHSSARS